ncbi:E3 ubiquitin-protein ligase TRIM39-like [Myripristis murdjan]|uniref:E3 ubiquitin-protein ligase TRIM39-like n=1 Tax=Myripristis murdjan TaxID=586833 RepID=UPI0011760AEA|nr:E3 ubiquitin-protein ligase TRIM39-like [Myripristis murdjan]XP_029914446.1 E3 ubiquitin-protein ligase TRIM39-like [Myripristis murdjan]
MALSSAFLSEDQFSCSICLDVFTNPVSTPCGHSFCQACISSYWDGKAGGGGSKSYMCPLCKETFRKRPELHINRTLKEITEQFKQMATTGAGMGRREEEPNPHPHRSQRQSLSSPLRPGEMPESVFAEMMNRFQRPSTTGSPPPAYPQTNASQPQSSTQVNVHPQAFHQAQTHEHHDPPPPYSPPRRYTLSGPGDSSSDLPLCPAHMRGLEFFCRTDQTCICSVCLERAEHRGHNAIPAKREWHIKKSQLGITEVELKDLISERERKMEEIQKSLQDIQAAAERETEGSVCVFAKLVSSVEHCQAEVLEVIEMARRAAEHRAKSLLRELEQEIAELKKRSTTLNQLAQSEDYILFLKTFPALSSIPPTKDWSDARVVSELTSGVVLKTVTQMMERFQEELHKLPEICQRSQLEQSVSRQSPKVRRVQEYAADITLDPHTAHPRLMISVDGKQVCCSDRYQPVPDNPERFDRVVCVLAREGFNSGRHYWEVEVGGKTDWDLGVASRSINRKGKITVSPAHGYWFLSLRDQVDYAFRTEPSTSLEVPIRPSRVGIYVDCDKGLLSFYNVEAKVLIYTFTDSFPDTIHPFFSPCTNKSGRNEAPLIICPVAPTE